MISPFSPLSPEDGKLWLDSLLYAAESIREAGFSEGEWHVGGSSSFYHLFRARMPRDIDIFTERPLPEPLRSHPGLLSLNAVCQPPFLRASAGVESVKTAGQPILFKKPHRTFEFKIYCRNGGLSRNDVFDMAAAMFFLGPEIPKKILLEREIAERCLESAKNSGLAAEIADFALTFIENMRVF